MKMIYLIGLPGSGKSTLMKAFMAKMKDQMLECSPSTEAIWTAERPIDLLDSHVMGNIRVLGKYEEGETFSGTDKLSMAVSPKAIEWVNTKPDEYVMAEGDRLNSLKFFDAVKDACEDEFVIINLVVSTEERLRRYKQRGSNQSDKFIQTVRTKIENAKNAFGSQKTVFGEEEGCLVDARHETEEDTFEIVDFLVDAIISDNILSESRKRNLEKRA